jgi:hypothetical protein
MSCDGGHLGFPIGIKNSNLVKDIPMIIHVQFGFSVHWMDLYNLKVFCSDMKFKMAATAGLSLTLNPMGKMFQNASSLKPLGQLKPNCPGMIIGRSSANYPFFMLIFMYSLALTIFVVSEKKEFEHFPIRSNVNLCPALAATLDFRSA